MELFNNFTAWHLVVIIIAGFGLMSVIVWALYNSVPRETFVKLTDAFLNVGETAANFTKSPSDNDVIKELRALRDSISLTMPPVVPPENTSGTLPHDDIDSQRAG